MKWKTIESAPVDGTIIDLWCVGDPSDIKFYTGHRKKCGRVADCYFDERWRHYLGLTRCMGLTVTPTHWMKIEKPE
jgi:hypothetical protein